MYRIGDELKGPKIKIAKRMFSVQLQKIEPNQEDKLEMLRKIETFVKERGFTITVK